ncbi:Uncharacterised protein [Mycobacteroides abscessus subsp. abscessus]|nr:Uncharacterised protein [Mycobacteroides abscessus subsp. abscessus]
MPAVGLGAVQIRLQDRAERREVATQLFDDGQCRVGGGVILRIDGDPRAHFVCRCDDSVSVRQGDLLAVTGK